MKHLGNVPIEKITVNNTYESLFPPLPPDVYEDLLASIKQVGVMEDLILEVGENGYYTVLAGHHRRKAAKECGRMEVPCSITETFSEKINALYNNTLRRQLNEAERTASLMKKPELIRDILEKTLIPEIYRLYKDGSLPEAVLEKITQCSHDEQKALFDSLSIIRDNVPEDIIVQHKKEIKELKAKHRAKSESLEDSYKSELKKVNKELEWQKKMLEAAISEKNRIEADRKELKDKFDRIEKKAKETLALYEKTKEEIAVDIRKEYEKDIEEWMRFRKEHNDIIKAKDKQIEHVSEDIKKLQNKVQNLESIAKTWQYECANFSRKYGEIIDRYSNPGLVEAQLQVALEYIKSLIKIVKNHKWSGGTLKTAKDIKASMMNEMDRLISEIALNKKDEDFTLSRARENVKNALAGKSTEEQALMAG